MTKGSPEASSLWEAPEFLTLLLMLYGSSMAVWKRPAPSTLVPADSEWYLDSFFGYEVSIPEYEWEKFTSALP